MSARIRLFGGATFGGRDEDRPLPVDRRGCLLAYLATDGGWVDRDRLALLFWPDSGEDSAKRNLRQLLLRTKRLELEPSLDTRTDAVRWHVDSDVGLFRRALAIGDHTRATALYRGPFLDGFALDGLAAAGAWIESERERLHAAFHGAAQREASALSGRGELDTALQLLADLHGYDEFAEDVVAAYITILARTGRRDAAIEAFERFATALREELGLEPLAATVDLIAAVRRGDALTFPADGAKLPASPLPGPLRSPRLVGREAERLALRNAATSLVVVAGAPGIGKSRLLRESMPQASYCGASEGLDQVPYHPLTRLIRQRPDAAASLGSYVEDLARLVPEVAPDLTPGPQEPDIAKGRLAEALARFIEAVGTPLIVDDLQWADPATLETLAYLTGRGITVFGAYRTAEAGDRLRQLLASYAARGELTEVELAELPEVDVRDLLADLMGRESGPPTFANWLWQRSSGNPMFLLESLKALFEAGTLWAEGDQWRTDVDDLTQDYTELDVPPLVSEVIVRRLANLSSEAQTVLRAVAVTGLGLDREFLASATGLAVAATVDALDESERAGFLTGGAFQHDLLRQSVYARIDAQRKRLLHMLAGDRFESAGQPELAAEHLWFAAEHQRARKAWSRHVWALRTRGLLVDAVEVLRRAVGRLPEGEDTVWLQLQLVDTVRESGRLEEAFKELDKVQLPADCSPELRFRHLQAVVAMKLQVGLVAEADELLRAARQLATLIDDEELLIDDTMFRARVARDQQRALEAIELISPVVERMRTMRPDVRLVQFLTSLAVLKDDVGEFSAALELHTEALALARALGSRYFQVEATTNMVVCLQSLGRYEEATELAEGMLGVGDYDNVPTLRINLASTYFVAGKIEDALRHYRQLIDRAEPHLRLIALARCVDCLIALAETPSSGGAGPGTAKLWTKPGGGPATESDPASLIDAALDELAAPTTDYPPAIGRAVVATLKHGSPEQRGRLHTLMPDLDLDHFPSYLQAELREALTADGNSGVARQ